MNKYSLVSMTVLASCTLFCNNGIYPWRWIFDYSFVSSV